MIRQSESIAKLAPALIAAQAEMTNAPKETKGQAKAAVIYYSDLATITDLVRPILAKHGLCFAQFPSGGGDETVTIATRIIHTSGEWLEDELSMPCGGNGAQGVGSAITYAKRYSLMAVLGVAADDDDGAAASHPPAQRKPPAEKPIKVISEGQRRMMFAATKGKGLVEAEIREIVARHRDGNESTADMPVAVFDLVLRDIEAGGREPTAALDPHKTSGEQPPLGADTPTPLQEGVDEGAVAASGNSAATTPEQRWADLVADAAAQGMSAARLKTVLRAASLATGPAGLATDAELERARLAIMGAK